MFGYSWWHPLHFIFESKTTAESKIGLGDNLRIRNFSHFLEVVREFLSAFYPFFKKIWNLKVLICIVYNYQWKTNFKLTKNSALFANYENIHTIFCHKILGYLNLFLPILYSIFRENTSNSKVINDSSVRPCPYTFSNNQLSHKSFI